MHDGSPGLDDDEFKDGDLYNEMMGYEEDMDNEHELTKAERREQEKEKRRYGLVKHLDPDLRPAKFKRKK